MPGVKVNLESAPTAEFNPTATGKWFIAGFFERGSTTKPILVTSMTEFEQLVGNRVSYSWLYDVAETFFEEGGSELFLARVVGKTPVAASHVLKHTAEASLKVAAKSVGEWGNELYVEVIVEAGEYKLAIYEGGTTAGDLVEESPLFKTQVEAVTWSEESPYVTITKEAGTEPPTVLAATALSGGTYDAGEVETVGWEEAFARFDEELGCGQVSAPGQSSEAINKAVLAHGEANNRTPVVDFVNTGVAATLEAAALALSVLAGARRGAGYAPWAIIPGLTPGTTRVVPYSAVQAGIFARNDGSASPPPVGEPSAGENGRPRFAIGLAHEWTKAEREALNNKGVNVARTLPSGVIETYGDKTLISVTGKEPAWQQVSAARLAMFVWAEGEALLEKGVFKNIDPKNLLFSKIEGDLSRFLNSLGNMLYSYSASTGPSVNTAATIKAKEVRADVEIKPTEIAENLTLNLAVQA